MKREREQTPYPETEVHDDYASDSEEGTLAPTVTDDDETMDVNQAKAKLVAWELVEEEMLMDLQGAQAEMILARTVEDRSYWRDIVECHEEELEDARNKVAAYELMWHELLNMQIIKDEEDEKAMKVE